MATERSLSRGKLFHDSMTKRFASIRSRTKSKSKRHDNFVEMLRDTEENIEGVSQLFTLRSLNKSNNLEVYTEPHVKTEVGNGSKKGSRLRVIKTRLKEKLRNWKSGKSVRQEKATYETARTHGDNVEAHDIDNNVNEQLDSTTPFYNQFKTASSDLDVLFDYGMKAEGFGSISQRFNSPKAPENFIESSYLPCPTVDKLLTMQKNLKFDSFEDVERSLNCLNKEIVPTRRLNRNFSDAEKIDARLSVSCSEALSSTDAKQEMVSEKHHDHMKQEASVNSSKLIDCHTGSYNSISRTPLELLNRNIRLYGIFEQEQSDKSEDKPVIELAANADTINSNFVEDTDSHYSGDDEEEDSSGQDEDYLESTFTSSLSLASRHRPRKNDFDYDADAELSANQETDMLKADHADDLSKSITQYSIPFAIDFDKFIKEDGTFSFSESSTTSSQIFKIPTFRDSNRIFRIAKFADNLLDGSLTEDRLSQLVRKTRNRAAITFKSNKFYDSLPRNYFDRYAVNLSNHDSLDKDSISDESKANVQSSVDNVGDCTENSVKFDANSYLLLYNKSSKHNKKKGKTFNKLNALKSWSSGRINSTSTLSFKPILKTRSLECHSDEQDSGIRETGISSESSASSISEISDADELDLLVGSDSVVNKGLKTFHISEITTGSQRSTGCFL